MAVHTLRSLITITNDFRRELDQANAGKKTSLPFIRHRLSLKPKVKKNEGFQVLRIGGSIYQNALVKRIDGRVAIIKSIQKPLPVFTTEAVFLTFIERQLDNNCTHLALNLAYPMEPVARDGYLDGTLLFGTKEHAFAGLVGKLVGKTIEEYVRAKQNRNIRVALANDTICLLLSGLTQFSQNQLAAGIIGTGMNFAIFL
ncbi:MAG: hypothetical protein AAB803_01400, partial [Patescibacteria group bacterium]